MGSPPPSRHTRARLIRAWLPTVFWIGVIVFESTSVFTSDHTQHWLYTILRTLFGVKVAAHAYIINEVGRKVGHFTGYGILSGLSFYGWTELRAYRTEVFWEKLGKARAAVRRWYLRAAVLAVLTTFAVACFDEFHQSFVPGRTGVFRDVILDTMGGIFAQILIFMIWDARCKKTQRIVTEPVPTGMR
ncbi:MAG: VanZ family protein [Terriglobales bacterium]